MQNNSLDLTNLSVEQTKKLNKIAYGIRREYAEFLDEYSLEHKGDIYWWMTPLMSRNIEYDYTLKKIAFLHLCIDEIENNECQQLIVDSIGLFKVLRKIYKKKRYILNTYTVIKIIYLMSYFYSFSVFLMNHQKNGILRDIFPKVVLNSVILHY